ncbi:hypothetical protein F3Y22_tig00110556pilonHSYRG00532 [Hibiscus syriacus]|uniref:Phytocyanin domain-containing protein n=1 Tax=Hibiscus syriacus TaxID=106335 RepID=A0A6A3ABX5_HIBSY|nr:hypothetical protein F3Y22_tig00110556pilonHSYRG00532 [Hibiscus syriacus]
MNGSVEASKQFTVGDHVGWQQPSANNTDVYGQWARSKGFMSETLSLSSIGMTRAGFFYFISGVLDHCKSGERLMIQVMGLHQRVQPPPAVANPQEVGIAPGPHPSSGILLTAPTLTSLFLAFIVTAVAFE